MHEKEMSLQQAVETKRLLEQLLENRGWQRLVAIVQAQADGLQQEILFARCMSIDSTLAQEYKKGQLEGRLCLSNLIETELTVCEETIKRLRRVEDADGESESEPSRGAGYAP